MAIEYTIRCYGLSGELIFEQDIIGLERAVQTAKHQELCIAFSCTPKPAPSYSYKLMNDGWNQITPEGLRSWLARKEKLRQQPQQSQES